MVKIAKKLHFSQGSQAKHRVIERRDFLDGNFLARWLVNGRAVQP